MDADDDWTSEAIRALSDGEYRDQLIPNFVKEYVPSGKVLDLGCNIAKFVPMWQLAGFTVEGFDQCEYALKVAKMRHPDVKFTLGRAQDLPYEKEFDLIFTSAVLQHNRHSEQEKIVEQIKKALKPGGYFLMSENTLRPDNWPIGIKDGKFDEDVTDGYSKTFKGWIEFFKKHGFEFVKANYGITLYLFRLS